jgi:hypothetical protein
MNQPLRLARGEMLYSDVRHIYGPLSPYINSLLYRIFGPSLTALYADGISTAMLILGSVYWLSRRLMGRAAAAATTLSVMWLCGFKQAGNYVLPYSYSALHGCAFGLVSLAFLVHFLERRGEDEAISRAAENGTQALPPRRVAMSLVLAGTAAGLAILAKTEMGFAAVSAGVMTVALAGFPSFRRAINLGAIYITPVAVLVLGVYGYFTSQVGWSILADDSFLFFQHLPPELVYFNKRVSGFDQPLHSIMSIAGAAVRVGALATVVGTISVLLTWRKRDSVPQVHIPDLSRVSDAGRASYAQIWLLFVVSLLIVVVPFAGSLNFEKGPYLAMPLLLVGLLGVESARFIRQRTDAALTNQTIIVLIVTLYALTSLARVILRVRSGGAYSSYLLPASVIVFTYAWVNPFANLFRQQATRRLARNIAVALILFDVAITASLLSFRFRDRNTYILNTDRGTIVTVPDLGQSINETIDFIKSETAPGDPVAVMPEGTSLNFFTGRPNPLREEITTPGYLDGAGEERAIRQLIQSNTRFVLVANRATSEFGAEAFGRDYCRTLMRWIEQNFEACAVFGRDHDPNQKIGDKTFFIRAYKKRSQSQ